MEGLPTGADAVMIGLVALASALAKPIRVVSAIRLHRRRSHVPPSKRRI
jgi:hypothetical protein